MPSSHIQLVLLISNLYVLDIPERLYTNKEVNFICRQK